VTKSVGLVGVLVARNDLVEALTKQRQYGMTNPLVAFCMGLLAYRMGS
jgi:hypothetical protein